VARLDNIRLIYRGVEIHKQPALSLFEMDRHHPRVGGESPGHEEEEAFTPGRTRSNSVKHWEDFHARQGDEEWTVKSPCEYAMLTCNYCSQIDGVPVLDNQYKYGKVEFYLRPLRFVLHVVPVQEILGYRADLMERIATSINKFTLRNGDQAQKAPLERPLERQESVASSVFEGLMQRSESLVGDNGLIRTRSQTHLGAGAVGQEGEERVRRPTGSGGTLNANHPGPKRRLTSAQRIREQLHAEGIRKVMTSKVSEKVDAVLTHRSRQGSTFNLRQSNGGDDPVGCDDGFSVNDDAKAEFDEIRATLDSSQIFDQIDNQCENGLEEGMPISVMIDLESWVIVVPGHAICNSDDDRLSMDHTTYVAELDRAGSVLFNKEGEHGSHEEHVALMRFSTCYEHFYIQPGSLRVDSVGPYTFIAQIRNMQLISRTQKGHTSERLHNFEHIHTDLSIRADLQAAKGNLVYQQERFEKAQDLWEAQLEDHVVQGTRPTTEEKLARRFAYWGYLEAKKEVKRGVIKVDVNARSATGRVEIHARSGGGAGLLARVSAVQNAALEGHMHYHYTPEMRQRDDQEEVEWAARFGLEPPNPPEELHKRHRDRFKGGVKGGWGAIKGDTDERACMVIPALARVLFVSLHFNHQSLLLIGHAISHVVGHVIATFPPSISCY